MVEKYHLILSVVGTYAWMFTFLFVSPGESGVLESGKPNGNVSGEASRESSLEMVNWAASPEDNHIVS